MRRPARTPARARPSFLEPLESRLLLTNVYAVQLTSPGAGVHGQAGCTITAGQLTLNPQYTQSGSTTAYVTADSAAQAVQQAITGSVTVNSGVLNYGGNGYKGFNDWADQTYTFDPTHSVTDPGVHQQDVAFYVSADGSKIGLEDLAHYPSRSDWDFNTAGVDDYWNVTTTQVTLKSLTVEDSLHTGTGVDANDTTAKDLYVQDTGSGADVNLSIASNPTTTDAQRHILYGVTPAAGANPATGHFADGSDYNSVHLDTSSGTRDFTVQSGVDLNLDGTLQPAEATRTVNVHVVKLNSLTATSAASANNSVTTSDTTAPDLYVGDGDVGMAQVNLSAAVVPNNGGSLKHVLWSATNDQGKQSVTPASGDFSGQNTLTLTPDGGSDYTVTAGVDGNNNGTLDPAEVTRTLHVHVVKFQKLSVADDNGPSNTANADTSTPVDYYVAAQSNGNASVDVSALYKPVSSGAGSHVLWAFSGGNASPTSGNFGDGDSHATLTPAGGNYDFALTGGFDTDNSGTLDPGEVTRTINVHVIVVSAMNVSSETDSTNQITANAQNTPEDLYVTSGTDGTATVDIGATFKPETQGSHVLWHFSGGNSNASGTMGPADGSGDFSVDDPHITMQAPGDAEYVAKLAVDTASSPTWGDATAQVLYTVNVHLKHVGTLEVFDSAHLTYSASAADTKPQDFYIAEPTDGTSAVVKLHMNPQIPYGDQSDTLWTINGTNGGLADHSFSSGDPQVQLLPADDAHRDFNVSVGYDLNHDGTLDPNEILRTVVVHVFTLQFLTTVSQQFPGIDVNYLPGHTGAEKDYVLMGTGSLDLPVAKATIKLTPDSVGLRNHLLADFVETTTGDFSDRSTLGVWDGDSVTVTGLFKNLLLDVKSMKVVLGLDYNGDGFFSKDEIIAWDPFTTKVVLQDKYDLDINTLQFIENKWSIGGLSTAANFLYCFLNDVGLSGATNVSDGLSTNAFGLSHNVGAIFNAAGNATINKGIFSPTSTLAAEVANSQTFAAQVFNPVFNANSAYISGVMAALPVGSKFTFTFDASTIPSVNFGFQDDPDLHYAFGKVTLSGLKVVLSVVKCYVSNGLVGEQLSSGHVSGALTDLYDFDLNDTTAISQAAEVQAGYGTLGTAGHVFREEVDLDNDAANLGDYAYQIY